MASIENLTVTVSEGPPRLVVAEGQIDAHTATSIDDALSSLPETESISVDLSEVTFVDSSGLRVLVRAHKRQRSGGGRLEVVKPSDAVSRLLEITGLTSELDISW